MDTLMTMLIILHTDYNLKVKLVVTVGFS